MVCLGNELRSFYLMRLHPSTAFWALLLTMRAPLYIYSEFKGKKNSKFSGLFEGYFYLFESLTEVILVSSK